MTYTYAPGAGFVVAAGGFLIFLPDDAKPDTLRELWNARSAVLGGGFLGVLSALTSSLDPTLENLPRFAVVELGPSHGISSEARVAVSGSLTVRVRSASSSEPLEFRGDGAAMWFEERVPDAVSLSVFTDVNECVESSIAAPFTDAVRTGADLASSDGRGPFAGAVHLPLNEGIAHASSVTWEHKNDLVEEPAKPSTTSAFVDPAQDEDFGRTLAQLPEDWESHYAGPPSDNSERVEAVPATRAFESSSDFGAPRQHEQFGDFGAPEVLPTQAIDSAEAQRFADEVVRSMNQVPSGTSATQFITAAGQGFGSGFGSVRFSHGEVIELGLPIVVGRKPSHDGSSAGPSARMVSVPSPSKDISRNHLLIFVENGHVLATDLASVNGSVLRRGGEQDRLLTPHEPTVLISDDVVDLGDGVTLAFEYLR